MTAIPATIAHRWLLSQIDNYLHFMEQATVRLIRANADAQATHQSVINVMQAAQLTGIVRVNFAAQSAP